MGKHLTYDQRCQLDMLYRRRMTEAAIAAKIGRKQTVVSRELCRNQGLQGYRFKQVQKKTEERRKAASTPPLKITPAIVALIGAKLREEQWSPEQISGWMQAKQEISVSQACSTTSAKANGQTWLIPNRINIDERPEGMEQRSSVGDWEADTITGAGHKGAILSLVERLRAINCRKKARSRNGRNNRRGDHHENAATSKLSAHHYFRQWQRVRRTSARCQETEGGILFCQALSLMGTRLE